jgi:hypothetical protein
VRWQIAGQGWPVGSVLIPAGAIIEGSSWNHMPLPGMPIDALPLDEEAAQLMLQSYPEELWHRLRFDPGIDVEAIKMKVAQLANTPRHPRPSKEI